MENVIRKVVKKQFEDSFALYTPGIAASILMYLTEWGDLPNLIKKGTAIKQAAISEAAKSKFQKMSNEELYDIPYCKRVKQEIVDDLKEKVPMLLKMDNNLTPSMAQLITSKLSFLFFNK